MTDEEIQAILDQPKSRLQKILDGPITTGLIIVSAMYFAVHIVIWIFSK